MINVSRDISRSYPDEFWMALSGAAAECQAEDCMSAAREVRHFPLWFMGIFAGN
jgi:hypothetical protein